MLVWQEHPSTASAKRPLTGKVTGRVCAHAIRHSDVRPGYVTACRSAYGPPRARLPLVHEIRYDDGNLGLTYTGVTAGGGFEDALYGVDVTPVATVNGSPAVASTVLGGNGTVAWEPAPGLVAYVGWSGATTSAVRLAEQSHSITAEQWLALTPQLVDQPNILGGQ